MLDETWFTSVGDSMNDEWVISGCEKRNLSSTVSKSCVGRAKIFALGANAGWKPNKYGGNCEFKWNSRGELKTYIVNQNRVERLQFILQSKHLIDGRCFCKKIFSPNQEWLFNHQMSITDRGCHIFCFCQCYPKLINDRISFRCSNTFFLNFLQLQLKYISTSILVQFLACFCFKQRISCKL